MTLAREMLAAAGIDGKDPAATLTDGTAMDVFRAMIHAQGGDLAVPLPLGQCQETVLAPVGGVMRRIDAMPVGIAAWRLGAGRSRPGRRCSTVPGCAFTVGRGGGGSRRTTVHAVYRHPGAIARRARRAGRWVGDRCGTDRYPLIIDRLPV